MSLAFLKHWSFTHRLLKVQDHQHHRGLNHFHFCWRHPSARCFHNLQIQNSDDVLVNSVPGKIVDIPRLYPNPHRHRHHQHPKQRHSLSRSNITAVQKPPTTQEQTALQRGDRVITSYKYEEGIVNEITAYHTGFFWFRKEFIFLNNSILSGAFQLPKYLLPQNKIAFF
jgi:hypothetical protein